MTPAETSGGPSRERFRRTVARDFFVRVHVSAVLAGTGATAFLVSKGLLALGVTSMPVRYLLAAVVGYAAFLGLVR